MSRLLPVLLVALALVAGWLLRGTVDAREQAQEPRIAIAPATPADGWQPVSVPWRPVHAPTPSAPAKATAPAASVSAPHVPRRAPSTAVAGTASWYWNGPGVYAAAGPSLRVGNWRGRIVTVCAGSRCLRTVLSDACQCYGSRLLDLSRDAFARLAPLSAGLVHVTVGY